LNAEEGGHDPLAPLRQTSFVLFLGSRFCSATAMTLLQAVMAWQVYDISGSALNLGLLGLARFLPSLGLSLVGGAVADAHNRRNVIMAAQTLPMVCSAILATATLGGWVSLGLIYGLVLFVAMAASFENPARQSLLPSIIPAPLFPGAVTLNSTFQTFGFVTGPLIGSTMIAVLGIGAAYVTHAALVLGSIAFLAFLRYVQPEGPGRRVSLAAIAEGVRFVRGSQVLLGAMSLDMFAVIFGGATALLPVYATDILHVGEFGYGALYASFEVGSFLMAVALVARPPIVRAGRALLITVAMFGVGTIVFGLSRSFAVSLAAYTFIGMADQLSVVLRQTTIQLSTPDELRGRVSSVSQVFIGASNQLGAVESGLVAALTSATFAVVSGGIACIGVVGVVAAKLPELRRYQISTAGNRAVSAATLPDPAGEG
jgi:MFS family permease